MGQAPSPFDSKAIWRAQIFVIFLALLGIGLFGGIWILLGDMGVADFPRLFAAMCIPPAIIALIVGFYFLIRANNNNK